MRKHFCHIDVYARTEIFGYIAAHVYISDLTGRETFLAGLKSLKCLSIPRSAAEQ